MRCHEDPPLGTPSRCSHLHLAWARLLDVCGGRVLGDPTTISRGHVWTAARLIDQGRGCFFLFIVVVDDSKESADLRRLASLGRALASCRLWGCSRWCCSCLGWPHGHRSLAGHPIISGRRRSVVFFVTAGVPKTPSSVVRQRIHSGRVPHTRC